MNDVMRVGTWMGDAFYNLFNAIINNWGVIGIGFLVLFVIRKIVDLVKRIFQF